MPDRSSGEHESYIWVVFHPKTQTKSDFSFRFLECKYFHKNKNALLQIITPHYVVFEWMAPQSMTYV